MHFKNSHKRKLFCDEYPTENLPQLATRVSTPTPMVRRPLEERTRNSDDDDIDEEGKCRDIGMNTDVPVEEKAKIEQLEGQIATLERKIKELKESDPRA